MSEPLLPLWELVQTSHVVTRQFRDLFAVHGLTPTQFGVLACLRDGDDFTKAQLARAVLITPQSMDPLIDSLLARALVERDGPPGRGRPAGIRITEEGRSITDRASTDVAALNTATRIGLPEHQIHELIHHLRAIRETLTAEEGTPSRRLSRPAPR